MATELTLAFLYTVEVRGRTVGGADSGRIQKPCMAPLPSSREELELCPWVL